MVTYNLHPRLGVDAAATHTFNTEHGLSVIVGLSFQSQIKLNITFNQELVALHTTPSMFGEFLVHAWR